MVSESDYNEKYIPQELVILQVVGYNFSTWGAIIIYHDCTKNDCIIWTNSWRLVVQQHGYPKLIDSLIVYTKEASISIMFKSSFLHWLDSQIQGLYSLTLRWKVIFFFISSYHFRVKQKEPRMLTGLLLLAGLEINEPITLSHLSSILIWSFCPSPLWHRYTNQINVLQSGIKRLSPDEFFHTPTEPQHSFPGSLLILHPLSILIQPKSPSYFLLWT